MKKGMTFTILIAASLILVCYGAATAGVAGGPHDFTFTNGGTFVGSNDQVCIYCHTPHSATGPDRLGYRGPLWNRTLNEGYGNFTMYTSAVFGTLPGTDSNKPTGNTLLCLSCHDGITNLGGSSILNPGGAAITFNNATIDTVPHDPANPNDPITKIIIGRDLSNDHPVSFTYNNTLDPVGLKDPAWVLANSALRLYNGRMECCTCHDPHEIGTTTGKAPFLRMSNAGSALCTTCHNK